MRIALRTGLAAVAILFISSCAEPAPSNHDPDLPSVDQLESLELLSWNLRFFPENGRQEIDRVTAILDSLNADIVCIQEIDQMTRMREVAEDLAQYTLIESELTDFLALGILYKHDILLPLGTAELFTSESYIFAGRYPLKVNFRSMIDSSIFDFTVIDVHLKARSGSSNIERRRQASALLHSHVTTMMNTSADTNVLIIGDWNDDMSTESGKQSFEAFWEDSLNYRFTTSPLAHASSNFNDSYPSWPSFIDHVLISRALFDEDRTATTSTIRLDAYMDDYFTLVSDHRPVLYRYVPRP